MAYIDNLPRVDSSRILAQMEGTALGYGGMKKEDRTRIVRQHNDNIRTTPRKIQKITLGALRQLGIPISKQ